MRLLLLLLLLCNFSYAQEDLLDEIDQDTVINNYATAAFKGLKIVNFESTKLAAKNQFTFVVAHRFGSVENGFDSFFGLDDAVTKLNFIYGISDAINIGVSRSSFQKTYEGSLKYRLIQQQENKFPFTIVGFNAVLVNASLEKENLPKLEFKHRLGYLAQVLVSRKFTENLSLEIAPTFFHDNYVFYNDQDNSQYALGIGGRYKLGNRWSINADYGWHLNRADNSPFKNPLSIGVDLETGGHVFQMHFTNAQPMNTNGFLGQSTGDWSEGDVYFGFNLSRVFKIMKMKYLFYFLIAAFFLQSCINASEDDLIYIENPAPESITYIDHIKPIIDNNCISCHSNPPQNGAPMSLENYENVVSAIDNNGLIDRISRQAGEDGAMPLGGPRLPQNLIDLIKQWEEEGFKKE